MEVIRTLLPSYLIAGELIIISSLFLAIRLKISVGHIFTVAIVAMGIICFFILKLCLEFAAEVTETSMEFARIPYLYEMIPVTTKDKAFWRSCRPMVISVGATFTINRETFPNISQDIILNGLINLLLTF